MGGAAATFAIVDAVALRPLPFPDADRIVRLRGHPQGDGASFSEPDYLDFAARLRTVSAIAAMRPLQLTLTGSGDAVRVDGAAVTPSLFPLLGIRPVLGRESDRPGRARRGDRRRCRSATRCGVRGSTATQAPSAAGSRWTAVPRQSSACCRRRRFPRPMSGVRSPRRRRRIGRTSGSTSWPGWRRRFTTESSRRRRIGCSCAFTRVPGVPRLECPRGIGARLAGRARAAADGVGPARRGGRAARAGVREHCGVVDRARGIAAD